MIYQCTCCNYETDRKSSLEKHLNSTKHHENVSNLINCNFVPASVHLPTGRTGKKVQAFNKTVKNTVHGVVESDIDNNLKCAYCKNGFSTKSSLKRHLDGRCKTKLEQEQEEEIINTNELITLKQEIINLKIQRAQEIKMNQNQIKSLKKENNKLTKEVKYFKELVKDTSKSNKSSPSTITYVLNNYQDAPPLLCLDDYSQLNDSKNMDLVEVLIHHQENNKLDHFIGDYLIG